MGGANGGTSHMPEGCNLEPLHKVANQVRGRRSNSPYFHLRGETLGTIVPLIDHTSGFHFYLAQTLG
jgi:hypothetical protein